MFALRMSFHDQRPFRGFNFVFTGLEDWNDDLADVSEMSLLAEAASHVQLVSLVKQLADFSSKSPAQVALLRGCSNGTT